MRACRCTLCLVIVALLILGFRNGQAEAASRQSKSFVYDRIAVELHLQPDGTLDVTERMTLRYLGGPFSSASRSIPLQRLDAIEAIGVTKGATAYSEVTNDEHKPATFHVARDSQNVAITWFYPPTSDSEQTFVLRYRVRGGVRVGHEEDELWWVAIFPDRSVPVNHSEVVLTLPSLARPKASDVSLPTGSGELAIEQNRITITRDQPLLPNNGLDVKIRLPGDLIHSSAPHWQGATNPVDATDPTPINIEQTDPNAPSSLPGIVLIVGLATVAGAVFVFLWSRQKRQQRLAKQRRIMEYNARHAPPLFGGPQRSGKHKRKHKRDRGSSFAGSTAQSDSGSSWSSSSSDSSWSSSSSDSSWSSSSSDSSWSSSSSDSSSSDSGGSGGGSGTAD